MRKSTILLFSVFGMLCCDDANDHGPLVGTWESDVIGGVAFLAQLIQQVDSILQLLVPASPDILGSLRHSDIRWYADGLPW